MLGRFVVFVVTDAIACVCGLRRTSDSCRDTGAELDDVDGMFDISKKKKKGG